MQDAYFGTKELYEVVLKANTPMNFGSRRVEVEEPILYFEKVNMAQLNEQSKPIMARGGWGNMPHVIWEDRSEMTFTLSEGVMSSIGMGILMSADMVKHEDAKNGNLYIPKREGPFYLDDLTMSYKLNRTPAQDKKIFLFEYEREVPQKKIDMKAEGLVIDKDILRYKNGDINKQYLIDYYFKYGEEALVYYIEKERFNGTFSLEAKFYTKDENDGINTTNIMFMPKVRVVSDINLRLGERADPTVSVFNVIAMPEKTEESREMIMKIVRLGEDIDADI